MKKILLTWAALLSAGIAMAQTDSTKNDTEKVDTIRIGGMIIIKKKNNNPADSSDHSKSFDVKFTRGKNKPSNVKTSYLVFDLGLTNFNDQTDYASAGAKSYARTIRPGEAAFTSGDLKLRNIKCINFNLWFFMQRRNLINHVLNVKYGLGLELNNYHFENNVSFIKGTSPYVFRDSINFSKNKLALDYLSVPLMFNFKPNPNKSNSFSMSLGVSAGYLYSSRNKQISDERGKVKNNGNYDVKNWKISYVGELGIGPLKLYGSYTPTSVFEKGLDMRPYSFGFRFGGWD